MMKIIPILPPRKRLQVDRIHFRLTRFLSGLLCDAYCISSLLLIFFLCLDDLSWGNPHYTAFLCVCSVKRFPGTEVLRSFEARGELGAGKLSLYRFSGTMRRDHQHHHHHHPSSTSSGISVWVLFATHHFMAVSGAKHEVTNYWRYIRIIRFGQ